MTSRLGRHDSGTLSWLLLALSLAGPVAGQQTGYPAPGDRRVNDFAELLEPEEEAELGRMLDDLWHSAGIEATVVTIHSIRDYGTGDRSIEAFATGLLNAWGIGDAERDDGVLLLVAVGDRKVRIELGAGYGAGHDARMQGVIDAEIVPRFRRGDFAAGILAGTRAITRVVVAPGSSTVSRRPAGSLTERERAVELESPGARTAPAASGLTGGRWWSGRPLLVLTAFAGFFVALAGIFGYSVHRSRRCPHCRIPMTRLDATADDAYLTSGQRVEEKLGSVDYEVWKCERCNFYRLRGDNRWGSRRKHCPNCGYKTLQVISRIAKAATYTSTGLQEIVRECAHCELHDRRTVVLPRRVEADLDDSGDWTRSDGSSNRSHGSGRSSSSTRSSWSSGRSSGGGSSFGGGRSSGGGATGGW